MLNGLFDNQSPAGFCKVLKYAADLSPGSETKQLMCSEWINKKHHMLLL